MSLKEQLINYFEFNKTTSGNFIFFDELPEERNLKPTKKVETQIVSQVPYEQKLKPIEIHKSSAESLTAKPKVGKKITDEKTHSKQIDVDFDGIELPNLEKYKTLEELKNGISNCQNCVLGSTRKNFVFGEGNPNADIMVIGEAPGADEDEQGMPFVGKAGKLLTDILKAINFERNDVYIANICKCRPPSNRKPSTVEVFCCEPYLKKQIELIKPKFILALGLTAAEALFKKSFKMGEIRGKLFDYYGIQTLITYHPAALLRNPSWKRPVWEDVQLLRRLYDEHLEK